jgi:hypothetical protein
MPWNLPVGWLAFWTLDSTKWDTASELAVSLYQRFDYISNAIVRISNGL